MPSALEEARALLGRSLDDVQRAVGGAVPVPDDAYGAMEDVISIAGQQGLVYLKDGHAELVYLDGDALSDVSPSSLAVEFGDPAVRLRSRAGKRANLWVDAPHGIAYSEQGGALDFVEVFRPRSQAEYETEIYLDPGPFIR